jgi:tRNA (guanine37-N1)-methyltransferase
MRLNLLTLFPETFEGPLNASLIKKAQEKGILDFNVVDLRQFAKDKHRTADNSPYGGGPGMVILAEIVKNGLDQVENSQNKGLKTRRILLTPAGEQFSQKKAKELAAYDELTFVCGHYEGVDGRIGQYIDEELSVGDYVLTGGEVPALVIIDAIAREIPGVIKEAQSVMEDSFQDGLLDYPCYTRPEVWEGQSVPAELMSGNHAEIAKWRRKQQLKKTLTVRPELLTQAAFSKKGLTKEDGQLLKEIILGQ